MLSEYEKISLKKQRRFIMTLRKKGGDNSSDDEIRYYLEAYGIHSLSEDTIITPEDMTESGYKEIPDSHLGQIGMMFQQLPGLASHAISYHGTYRVYFDKSLGVLQQAKQGDGFLRANVVQAGTNNKITGQALLKSASMGPLVANAVFSALSMVTGQYFLSEINSKLSSIDKKVDGIRQFLEMEKSADSGLMKSIYSKLFVISSLSKKMSILNKPLLFSYSRFAKTV